jgi:hypothetical protein
MVKSTLRSLSDSTDELIRESVQEIIAVMGGTRRLIADICFRQNRREMGIAETATHFGRILGVASAGGTFPGGTLADQLALRDRRIYA